MRLDTEAAHALAVLTPLLGCGEEAAALAFDGLSASADADARRALQAIAAEEREHDALLRRLAWALPAHDGADALRASQRFHMDLGSGAPALHLARIAAIDAAVCTVLSRLLRPGSVLAGDPAVLATLTRIRRDEGTHVRVSRGLALAEGAPLALRHVGGAARGALAQVLMLGAGAFETLGVDPDMLERDIRRLPDGLLSGA